jgi:hypothetical protein
MMRHLLRVIRRRIGPVAGACVLLAGGIGAGVLAGAGGAQAAACSGAVVAGTTCTDAGALTFSGGSLTLTSPTALAWTATNNGLNQSLVDTTTAQQSYVVNDATGSGAGWNVTVSATTFTNGTVSLPNAGTFSTNGSITSAVLTTTPTGACTVPRARRRPTPCRTRWPSPPPRRRRRSTRFLTTPRPSAWGRSPSGCQGPIRWDGGWPCPGTPWPPRISPPSPWKLSPRHEPADSESGRRPVHHWHLRARYPGGLVGSGASRCLCGCVYVDRDARSDIRPIRSDIRLVNGQGGSK